MSKVCRNSTSFFRTDLLSFLQVASYCIYPEDLIYNHGEIKIIDLSHGYIKIKDLILFFVITGVIKACGILTTPLRPILKQVFNTGVVIV